MSSILASSLSSQYNTHLLPHDTTTSPDDAYDYDSYYKSPQSALPIAVAPPFGDFSLYSEAFALLQQPAQYTCMNSRNDANAPHPNIRVQTSTPTPALPAYYPTPTPHTALSAGSSSLDYGDWMYNTSMGGPAVTHTQGSKRARSHQRTPSASTVASNGPSSPYTSNFAHPQIVNTDYAPQSPAHFADQAGATFSKTPVDANFLHGYMPSQAAHSGGAHQAMKGFAIDHHNGEDFPAEFGGYSSRQSISSYNHDSPATPQSGAGETAQSGYSLPQQMANPNVRLFRSESDVYQDELYNPSFNAAPTSVSKPANNFLTPHRSVMSERLQTANIARSQSPTSSVSRERSPFRDGSPLAPAGGWRSPAPAAVGTAAGMRQQQKEQAEQAERAQHMPALQREPMKTISPKDALLDYNEQEQPSLFQDTIPAGYKQHTGGTEQWPTNNFFSQPGTTFGSLQTPSQHAFTNFRATGSADGYSGSDMNFQSLPPTNQVQNGSYFGDNSYAAPVKMESNPEFPAHLTNMESSMSDNPPASQESAVNNASTSAPVRRPSDTRAGTGAYSCTYHGCAQRFDSQPNLQKHKRDVHRSQQQHRAETNGTSGATSSDGASSSPRSTESPAPSSGMTSASLAARNSQAGPHKCTRINPSTNKPCNTIFSRPYDLTRHEDTIHNNRKTKVRCPMCREEKTFSRNDALTRHMRVVHPEVESFGKRQRRD